MMTNDDWWSSMNDRRTKWWTNFPLSAVSCYDDKYFCDSVSYLMSCRRACICCRRALLWDAYGHFVCAVWGGSMTTDSCCMDHIENPHRCQHRVASWRQRQRRLQQQRLLEMLLKSVALEPSVDLTTSNKDDALAQNKLCLFFLFSLFFFQISLSHTHHHHLAYYFCVFFFFGVVVLLIVYYLYMIQIRYCLYLIFFLFCLFSIINFVDSFLARNILFSV